MEHSRKDWTTAITFLLLLTVFLAFNFLMVRGFLLSVLMGGILALLTRPLYRKLQEKHFKSKTAAAAVTLLITFIIIGPLLLFAFVAVKQGIALGTYLAENDVLSFDGITEKISQLPFLETFVSDPAAIEKQLRASIRTSSSAMSGAILGAVGSLPNVGLQLVLALLSCFFLLIDGKKFVTWLNDKIPLDWDVRARLYRSFQDTAISVIWATLAAAAVQAALMFGGYLVLGVPAAFLAAGATFIFAWIPILGSTPVWVAGAIYLFSQGKSTQAVIMIVLGLFTSVIDNYIRPMVLKGRGDIHPLVSLVAIFGGINMFGVMGVFVGPILAAVLISLLQIWPVVGRRFGLTYEIIEPGAGTIPSVLAPPVSSPEPPEKNVLKGAS
jgi:predicted PurR-regulated permease PerM